MLEIKGLKKRYEIAGETTVALDDVTLTLPDKGLVLITGKNGSGKTTLLNMIGLLDTPDNGSIRLDGKEIIGLTGNGADEYRQEKISFIFQTLNLVSTMTAKENLLLVGIAEDRALSALQSIGLNECVDKLPKQMSQGQAQKVAVQRAMLSGTSIILADEPTSALDKEARADVANLLAEASKNKLVLVITHDLQLFDNADMLIRFENGKAVVETYEKDNKVVEKTQELSLKQTAKKFSYKNLLASAMRASKGKIVSTIVISLLLLFMFISINIFISAPGNYNLAYKSLAKYYEENNFQYVISGSVVEGAPRNSCLSIKEFKSRELNSLFNNVVDTDNDTEDMTGPSLYYQGDSTPVYVVQSGAIATEVNGRMPSGKEEIVITDYYADLLIHYYKFANYQDVLDRAYLTLEFDGVPLRQVKVVGITSTDKDNFANLKNFYGSDIEAYQDDGRITSEVEKEWVKFTALRKYSLACVYMQEGFDDNIAQNLPYINCSVTILESLPYSMTFKRLSASEIDSNNVYTINDGDGLYILLSDVASENQIYQVIKDCTNDVDRHNAIAQFVKSIDLSKVELSNYYKNNFKKSVEERIQAPVVGFIDDTGKDIERAVYATDNYADWYYQDCLNIFIEENPLKSYVKMTTADEVYNMFKGSEIKGDFPATDILAPIGRIFPTLVYASLIVTVILLIFVIALLFNDTAYYFKNHTRDFAVFKALGVPLRKLAFVSMIRYCIMTIVAILISIIIACIMLPIINSYVAVPYSLTWLAFNPLSIIADVVLAGIIIAIAFAFQYRIMRRKSIGQLLKGA